MAEEIEIETTTSDPGPHRTPTTELHATYTTLEILVALVAVVGNAMVIYVFRRDRRLRRRTNYYIVSLATADFLVGLFGIPFAILASVGLPRNLHACLFTVSLLVMLCTISIFCLVAVSVDRYWAILYPMCYSRNVRTKTAIFIISVCWIAGVCVGLLPLFGWHADVGSAPGCYFVEVMDYNYLLFLYFATIVTPSVLLAAFYAHIYRVVVKQLSEVVTVNGSHGRGTMLRVLGPTQKREVKATQNLAIIVFFFILCWIPLYTVNAIKAFVPDLNIPNPVTYFCIIFSHLNSAINPLLYAYHLKDFRAALKGLIYTIVGKGGVPIPAAYRPPAPMRRPALERCNALRERPKIYVDSPIWLRQREAEIIAEDRNKIAAMSGNVTPDVEPFINTIGADHSSGQHTSEERESDGPYLIDANQELSQSPYKRVEKLIRRVRSVSADS
ncbi:adenosine receptor A3 [Achroia grisella]|uniref:adenosine receptor A3 n=1 Tax=Achroia grisella TaxID=688607 RepID=UPI0027D2D128|nr:adenosine receptor A3 [Achroia grisella]